MPIFDTQDVAGDTDLLIKNIELGRALAKTLGDKPAALMRGHGSVVVGRSAREAVYRAIFLEESALIQTEAAPFGKTIKFLTPGEAKQMDRYMNPDGRRPWDLWRGEAAARRAT